VFFTRAFTGMGSIMHECSLSVPLIFEDNFCLVLPAFLTPAPILACELRERLQIGIVRAGAGVSLLF